MSELRNLLGRITEEDPDRVSKINQINQALFDLTDFSKDNSHNIPLYESIFNRIYLAGSVYQFDRDLDPVEFDKPCRRYDILSEWEGISEDEIVKLQYEV